MKKLFNGFLILSLIAFVALLIYRSSQPPKDEQSEKEVVELKEDADSEFDPILAAQLKADDYGMSSYVMAFLKAGPNRDQDSTEAARLQRAHLDNINKMAEAGTLVLAGPFLDDGEIRGIYVFNVGTIEEARALTESDPAIQAGRLTMELHPWYGSASMKMINEWHQKIARVPV